MKKIFLLLVLLMGFVVMANAETVSYVNYGLGVGDVNITFDSQALPGNPYIAGQILVSSDGSDPFAVYCVSVKYEVEDSQEMDVKPLSTMTNAFNPEVDEGSGAKVAWLLNTYAFGVDSNVKGAALQLSIWEVLYDTDAAAYDLSSGTFQATTGVIGVANLASTYLNSIGNNVSDAYWFDTRNYSSNDKLYGQDYGAPIPEPGSLLLLGTGLGGICLGCFRRRKQ